MKIQKLRKYLMTDEKRLYEMVSEQLKRLGYEPELKYEEKTYRYKSYGSSKYANVRPLPKDVVKCEEPQYLYAKGKLPVLLVAHTDIVHSREPSQIFFDSDAGVLWSPEGLGADDRAGVFAVLELAARFNVGVLLCSGEESGGTGVSSFTYDYPDNLGYKMAIELDRCGIDDCVFYDNESKDFHQWVETFGFKKSMGSFSDISILGPSWGINAVNLSIGYEEEHTTREHLFVRELYRTIDKVGNILSSYIPEFEYSEFKWKGKYDNYVDSYGRGTSFNGKDYCDFCACLEILQVVEGSYLCSRCFEANAFICSACCVASFNSANIEDASKEGLCEDCVQRYFVKDAGTGDESLVSSDVVDAKPSPYVQDCIDPKFGVPTERKTIPIDGRAGTCDYCGQIRVLLPYRDNSVCYSCIESIEYQ